MRMDGKRLSENVVDATDGSRSSGKKKAAVGGGIGAIVIAIIAVLMGADPMQALGGLATQASAQGSGSGSSVREPTPEEDALKTFVSQVLGDTEDTWTRIFREELGKPYESTTLYFFAEGIDTACDFQTSAVGPFYCPADQSVYIDLTFFNELAKRHSAAGDFAQAYVVAHEVGHHVQKITGVAGMIAKAKSQTRSQVEKNRLTVRQELHADFLAGVWAHHAQKQRLLERGDLQEALRAAKQIGDDTLQKRATGRVQPEGFTHGTAEQRQRWFMLGYDTGIFNEGNRAFELSYDDL